jgi:5-formyltetrahydrofolate cyclo-ligase
MKVALRKQLRARRRALGAARHRAKSRKAARAVMRLPMFAAGKRVALYSPFDRETDTAALESAARRRGVRVYLPVIIDRRHGKLRFMPFEGRTRRGLFGIAVPAAAGMAVQARWLNLIVVPLVGVDGGGRRLGMGGGFYDRALAFRRHRCTWGGPHLVGLGFDCQRTPVRFAEDWDLRLDSLATESGLERYHQGLP